MTVTAEISSAEIDGLDPPKRTVTLSTGLEIELTDLKARQFFALLRILTHGGSIMLERLNFRAKDDEFIGQLIGLLIFAIPEAFNETIDFVRSMIVQPKGLEEEAQGARKAIMDATENPELEDLLAIVENVVQHEGKNLQALGNRLRGLFKLAEKTGQVQAPSGKNGRRRKASVPSPEPST